MSKFTLEFGPQSTARLEQIAEGKELKKSEVVRRALELYSHLLEATEDDGKIVLQDKEGNAKEVVVI